MATHVCWCMVGLWVKYYWLYYMLVLHSFIGTHNTPHHYCTRAHSLFFSFCFTFVCTQHPDERVLYPPSHRFSQLACGTQHACGLLDQDDVPGRYRGDVEW
jgi:hypothetical protein